MEKWSGPGCVLELGLWDRPLGRSVGGKRRRYNLPPSRWACTTPNRGQDRADLHPLIIPSRICLGTELCGLFGTLHTQPELQAFPAVPAEGAGKAHGKFSLPSPGASAQKGRHVAAGGRQALGVSRRVTGHLESLCHDLLAGMALPEQRQAPPREAATSHACS